jgi:hypothetical protein
VFPLFDIENLFFPITHIVFNSEYKIKRYAEPPLDVAAALKKIPRHPNWRISLRISTPEGMDNETFPYEFFLSVSAILIRSQQEEMDKEQIKKMRRLLYVNGASVLYSAARDRLLLLTGDISYPKYCLSSYRFNPDESDALKNKTRGSGRL